MKKFYEGVIKLRIPILIVFILAFVFCAVIKDMVVVNYDMNDYLPKSTPSTVSLEVMTEEFTGGIPGIRVMVPDVTVPQALEYKAQILAVDGVQSVSWLDDSVDITVPLEMLDADALNTYYKDSNALFVVTIDEGSQIAVVDAIREIIGENGAMTGSNVSNAYATVNTVKEIGVIAACAVAFVFVVLLFTTTSWFEPVLILAGLGVAIVINSGSNLIFGEISFVTNAAGSILQLAVSLDYSVFLLHRFAECRKQISDPKAAMVDALCKSTSSILSSGLTTVIGFLALALMQFRLGPDLGIALAKGIVISLLTVFFFMPSIVLLFYKLMDKTKHRSFAPTFKGLGKVIRDISIPLTVVFAIVIIPSYLASNSNSYFYGSSRIYGEGTQYGDDTARIEAVFGKSDTYVLMVPKGDTATEKLLSSELKDLPQVTDIISFVDAAGAEIPHAYLDEETLSLLQSENYSRFVITVAADVEGEETFELVEKVREIANDHYPYEYRLAGTSISTYDLMTTVTSDMVKVNLLAIAAVFIVLVITMRSFFVPVILVLGIETAIWLNLAIPYFAGDTIYYIAYLIISSIQLGATVDYAILMTDRYKENRVKLNVRKSVVRTISDVTVSILTSGSALTVVGLLLGYLSTNELLAQLGIFIGRGALLSLAIVMFVLPGLLMIFDKFVTKEKKGN